MDRPLSCGLLLFVIYGLEGLSNHMTVPLQRTFRPSCSEVLLPPDALRELTKAFKIGSSFQEQIAVSRRRQVADLVVHWLMHSLAL